MHSSIFTTYSLCNATNNQNGLPPSLGMDWSSAEIPRIEPSCFLELDSQNW